MNKQKTTMTYIILLGVTVLVLFAAIHDLNRIVDTNYETIPATEDDINNSFFIGTVLPIPKEIYYQDWVYVQDVDSRVYEKCDVLSVYTDHSAGTVLVKFPDMLDDGYLYYDYGANISNDWWQPHFNARRNITFAKIVLDDFATTNETDAWAEV